MQRPFSQMLPSVLAKCYRPFWQMLCSVLKKQSSIQSKNNIIDKKELIHPE